MKKHTLSLLLCLALCLSFAVPALADGGASVALKVGGSDPAASYAVADAPATVTMAVAVPSISASGFWLTLTAPTGYSVTAVTGVTGKTDNQKTEITGAGGFYYGLYNNDIASNTSWSWIAADLTAVTLTDLVTVTYTRDTSVTLSAGTLAFGFSELTIGNAANNSGTIEVSGATYENVSATITLTGDPVDKITTIASAADLKQLADSVNGGADYSGETVNVTAASIDLSAYANWTPIGSASNPFKGTFKGNNAAITGLSITDVAGGNKGLFGYVGEGGTVQNFSVAGTITGSGELSANSDNIGGVAGYNAGTVSGVTSSVTITVSAYTVDTNTKNGQTYTDNVAVYAVGGVVGQNDGDVRNSANTGNITGGRCVGGVVGRSYGLIESSYNKGNITCNDTLTGKKGIGGVVGQVGNKATTSSGAVNASVLNCYNTGTVTAPDYQWIGGITGFCSQYCTLQNCYDTGNIVCSGSSFTKTSVNPIIGDVDTSDVTTASYANVSDNYSLSGLTITAGDSTSNNYALAVGTVKTSDEMKEAAFVLLLGDAYHMDAGETGYTQKNSGYPILSWQGGTEASAAPIKLVPSYSGGVVTVDVVATEDIQLAGFELVLSWTGANLTINYDGDDEDTPTKSSVSKFANITVGTPNDNNGVLVTAAANSNAAISAGASIVTYAFQSASLDVGTSISFLLNVQKVYNIPSTDANETELSWSGANISGTLTIASLTAANFTDKTGSATPATIEYDAPAAGDFTVKCAKACAVAYSTNNGATWTKLPATAVAGAENTYSFTLPDGYDSDIQIAVAIKGDITGDGVVNSMDATRFLRIVANLYKNYTALDVLTGDATGDGLLNSMDATRALRVVANLASIAW